MVSVKVTYRDAFFRLGACINWRKSLLAADGKPPRPGFFSNLPSFKAAISSVSRTTFLKLANRHRCYACDKPIDPLAVGDHVVAKSKEGTGGSENYAPMCVRCNSSKKDRDALECLAGRGFTLGTMNLEVLIVYARRRTDS